MNRTKIHMRHFAATACGVAMATTSSIAPIGAMSAAQAQTAPDRAMVLSVGESRVINVSAKMVDVVIANPGVVDVHVRSQNQLYILAKAPGESSVAVTGAGGKTLFSTTVRVGNNLNSVDQMLKLAMPEADITVSNLNGLTLLTGTVKAPEDAAEAERLVQAFTDPSGKAVTVVSRLRTATPLQVNLQVRFAEVSRSLLHKIGTNLASADLTSGSKLGAGFGRNVINDKWTIGGPLGVGNGIKPIADGAGNIIGSGVQSVATGATVAMDTKLFGLNILAALDLAESAGLSTTLAQPNLTSLSGETASFLAGGEYPYQINNGNQGNSIEFKQYGVQLAFTPTVLADGRISLRVRPSVSSLDFSVLATIPAIKTRSAETTVELGSGQAFMIAGLLSNDTDNAIDKVPGVGNIPILGSLFKSRKFQRNETELVIVVTPYLVRPVNATDIHLPTDGFRNATELQGLLKQQSQDGVSGGKEPMPSIAPSGTPANPATAPTTAPQSMNTDPRARKSRRTETAANAPTPGFSF